ncbi:MAG TPA: 5'/3'-nucleotidase SurE [Acidimicrobiales bacterium]
MTVRRRLLAFPVLLALALGGVACGGDDGDDAGSDEPDDAGSGETETTEPEAPAEPLRILVTNDDGVGGEGIAAVVEGLRSLDDVEVTVVAPAENQSGTGGNTSPTPPAASEAELVDGTPAIAVAGFPADAVVHGLENVLDEPPHLVVSGINQGQNLGPIVEISGTVGAARRAAEAGVPALAVSQGLGAELDYPVAVELVLDWVEEHRDALLAGEVPTDEIVNLNVPSCDTGELRGVAEVPTATDVNDRNPVTEPSDCEATTEDPVDDIDAFLTGYAALSTVTVP